MASCELCNKFGSAKMKYDLDSAKQHASTHFFEVKMIDDQVSADLIFEDCFPFYHEPAKRCGGRAKSLSRKILVDLCHSLFPKKRILNSPSNTACTKCGAELKLLVQRDKYLNIPAIIEHACSHLDESKLYGCRHCSREFKTSGAVRVHLANVHRIRPANGHFEDNSQNFKKEICAQIKTCFGPSKKSSEANSDGNRANIARKIRRGHRGSELSFERHLLCQQLTRNIADRDQRVKCRLCSSRIAVRHKHGYYKSRTAMEHVLLHLEKPTTRCRICSEAFSSKAKVTDHLKNIHALPLANNYDCLEDEFHTEIFAMLETCYGTKADGNVVGDTIAPRSATIIRQNTKGSKLTVERTFLCHRLIRKFSNREKQLLCRLCSKWINAKQASGSLTLLVTGHALLHLAKPLLHCKLCSATYSCSSSMVAHLKVKHALPLEKNHVSYEDEYHSEILAVLRECYGDERNEMKKE